MKGLLTTDHRELDEMLGQLFSAIDTGTAKKIYEKLDIFWARLAMHIRAENIHLFPAILKVFEAENTQAKSNLIPHIKSVRKTINNLHDDHNFFMQELGSAVKEMRKLCESRNQDMPEKLQPVNEIIINVSHRLQSHNQVEEMQVYKWAETLFIPAECWILDEQIQKELDNLPPRFR